MPLVSLSLPRYFGGEPLLLLPGGCDYIASKAGYIPLLVNFIYEDKAAKGLRKRTVYDKRSQTRAPRLFLFPGSSWGYPISVFERENLER